MGSWILVFQSQKWSKNIYARKLNYVTILSKLKVEMILNFQN